uniref:Expanded n=1 Tax=Euborellia annulipes TaxID=146833 RepID=A0A8S4BZD7_9NEOP|nr:Expanded [Euborellia annulipes]CAG6407549.1 Expanded [Euborellia annulipes]
MRNSTVSAPLESCTSSRSASSPEDTPRPPGGKSIESTTVDLALIPGSASLSPSSRFVAVHLLTGRTLFFSVEPKARTKELFQQTCTYLEKLGFLDWEIFGLAILSDGDYLFVDPDNKLSKYAPKNWKSSNSHGLDANGRPILALYLRVQFYVENPEVLRGGQTQNHYYLQLRENALRRDVAGWNPSEQALYLLAGLALQADLGDFCPEKHPVPGYFQPSDYLPSQMVSSSPQLVQTLPSLHSDNRGQTQSEAQLQYIREAICAGVALNAHVYRLRLKKQEMGPGDVWLAICPSGLQLQEMRSVAHGPTSLAFRWNNIVKLCFDRKKFEIRIAKWPTSTEKYTYYSNSDEKSKSLLLLCRITHQFWMTIQERLNELRHRKEEEERSKLAQLYMYPAEAKGQHNSDQQRISVISNTSSNTTSGIVSDRVQSLDESEDDDLDNETEIMINSPPAPSVESLALAHLRDVSETKESSLLSPLSHLSLPQTSKDKTPSPPLRLPLSTKSAHSSTTLATTDGSQCSSSCSTVVMTVGRITQTQRGEEPPPPPRRRPSTASSLELGYSHTAQNSQLSDSNSTSVELDYSVQSAHTSSGIYTLRSSCDAATEAGTETITCSSETSGVYASLANASNVPLARTESSADSIVSNSGSFHGDGSDPSEVGPRLTAEELSNLIVGHASGVYPSRATVSSTLDSDSDYVTLPPPPPPPYPVRSISLAQYSYTQSQQEEANARFITSKPQINILTAHTSLVSSSAAPSFATPTLNQVHSLRLYPPGDTRTHPPTHVKSPMSNICNSVNYGLDPGAKMKPQSKILPIISKNNYLDVHASRSTAFLRSHSYGQYSPQRQFTPPPPPPVLQARQPPPPPPNQSSSSLATVYTSQVTRGQIEQFQQQMYSDVDYVIYPLKDPAISKQEYMDAKQSSLIAAHAAHGLPSPPPPYPVYKNRHFMHRSTPNVAASSGQTSLLTLGLPTKYNSNQSLSTDIYPSTILNTSTLHKPSYAPSSLGINNIGLEFPAHSAHPTLISSPSPIAVAFARARSDDNILNSYEKPLHQLIDRPQFRRLPPPPPISMQPAPAPPPPPPPPYDSQILSEKEYSLPTIAPRTSKVSVKNDYSTKINAKVNTDKEYKFSSTTNIKNNGSSEHAKSASPKVNTNNELPISSCSKSSKGNNSEKADNLLDIRTLREKSKNLDLPLISALCNDRSLLQQTNAFVMPKHPASSRSVNNTIGNNSEAGASSESLTKHHYSSSSANKIKYPVSGLSTTQITKSSRNKMPPVQHQHPVSVFTSTHGTISRINSTTISSSTTTRSTVAAASLNASTVPTTTISSGSTSISGLTPTTGTQTQERIHK